ncbi:septation regulator SpoVG [Butyrivibrio sp. VCD2006]|uniref:septation regulator SpoVG n=1 Tax=Butyrivibrio sp. VCD2006 TaxID=1280664 RepID=UPI000405B48C|nr:septation regulator SpoVG [Butyrivibrio sp. VCD2006]
MNITDVRVRKVAKQGKMRAIVSITIDNEFVVHDIKVIEGDKGLFIAMPSKKSVDGEYRDIAHPINSDTRRLLQDTILKAYDEASDEVIDSRPADTEAAPAGVGSLF